ncbi:hypothetical protein ATPR_2524 [Acetobacter tropicalis NBRC 101654]|uniref:DUF4145 domain-containing protein n=1 Tax=Acetobacter tropicalis NBRC 101654 TaxID=749388 RepID=F7VGM5_9PROT|nr:DUF4145 domain-containing protein [Acetobacter tropicalis]GAA09520.1 hypothetical protein ATPR_2524 [Acetobacter tropicalis NBRC 101654]
MSDNWNWECPYCGKSQVVTRPQSIWRVADLRINGQKEGPLAAEIIAIGCSNTECLKTTIKVSICEATYPSPAVCVIDSDKKPLVDMYLLPFSSAKPQPDYIPEPIREDYYEACKIRDLSPKASATLIRRCLQGMIRDFAGIKKNTLNGEITALKEAITNGTADRSITPESVEAIDHIRTIGNIGAHMEKDINTIIDVEPNEAEVLINVTEMLFDEWYGARHKRAQRLAQVMQIADDKKQQKAIPSPS